MLELNFEKLDERTKQHSLRVAELSSKIAMEMGFESSDLFIAALYHDIGKIKISKKILFKPSRLTDDEFLEIKNHSKYGSEIMKGVLTKQQRMIILYHHENEDGSGYYHKTSDEIPFESKIIHVADVYDALVSQRCYKNSLSVNETLDIIKKSAGMFDRNVLNALFSIVESAN